MPWSASDPRVLPNVTHFAESGSYGPGAHLEARNASLETVLKKEEVERAGYTIEDVFGSKRPGWIDAEWL